MLFCALILAVLVTSHAWVLETTLDAVTSGTSHNVELVCRQNDFNGTTIATLKSITRMRITKLEPFCSKTTFVDMRQQTDMTLQRHKGYTVEGRMDKMADAFIKVTWPVATKETAGAYECLVDGFDSNSNFISVTTKPKLIKEQVLSIDEVNRLIQAATSGYKENQEKLESQIAALRSLLARTLQDFGRDMDGQSKTLKSEIAKVRSTTDAEFVQKNDLSQQFSTLEKTMKRELVSHRQENQEQRAMLLNTTSNLNNTCQDSYKKISSEFEKATIALETKIKNGDRDNQNSTQRVNSTMQSLYTDIIFTAGNLRSRIDSLENELEWRVSEAARPCPTPTTTTTTTTTPATTKAVPLEWPGGDFRLVKPASGCPSLKSATEAKFASTKYFNVKLVSATGAVGVTYCQHHGSPSTSSRWPEGTYCLARTAANCPQGFSSGYFRYSVGLNWFRYKNILYSIGQAYCCRSDGNVRSGISLPKTNPFYLFRYKGRCQNVEGMRVRQDKIIVMYRKQALSRPALNGNLEQTGTIVPDMEVDSKEISTTIEICYYSQY